MHRPTRQERRAHWKEREELQRFYTDRRIGDADFTPSTRALCSHGPGCGCDDALLRQRQIEARRHRVWGVTPRELALILELRLQADLSIVDDYCTWSSVRLRQIEHITVRCPHCWMVGVRVECDVPDREGWYGQRCSLCDAPFAARIYDQIGAWVRCITYAPWPRKEVQ